MAVDLRSVDDLDLAAILRPGDGIVWPQASAEPRTLVEHLCSASDLPEVTAFVGIRLAGSPHYHNPAVRFLSYTGAGPNAGPVSNGDIGVVPAHYSSFPRLFASGGIRADVVLVQVSEPDPHGRYNLGLARDYVADALRGARCVIAEVHPSVPTTSGSHWLTPDEIDFIVPGRHGPAELMPAPISAVQRTIAHHVAGLVEDGSTLQFGVGSLAAAVMQALAGHSHLGVHSGVLGDGIVDLVEAGAVTGDRKALDHGRIVAGLLMGSRRLFDFAAGHPDLVLRETSYTHAPAVLEAQARFVAVNSALEVDLTGQVNAEVAGGRYLGSVGGAGDFLRAASRSAHGAAIVALPSRTGSCSRIVARLGGPVSTTRSDVGLVVTEHGVADLRARTLEGRVEAMIAIADPRYRDELAAQADALMRRAVTSPSGVPAP